MVPASWTSRFLKPLLPAWPRREQPPADPPRLRFSPARRSGEPGVPDPLTSRACARRPRGAGRPGAALIALLVLAPLAAAACGGDGDDTASTGGEGEAQSLGAALADAAGDEATDAQPSEHDDTDDTDDTASDDGASDAGTDDEGSGDGGRGAPSCPAPTFPESSPPTTVEGMEAVSIPGANGDDPIFGQLVVDLEPGGYLGLPTHLRRGQHIQVLTSADDGIRSRTTVFAPDGSTVGHWDSSGRPGDIEGYYWDDNDVLPPTAPTCSGSSTSAGPTARSCSPSTARSERRNL